MFAIALTACSDVKDNPTPTPTPEPQPVVVDPIVEAIENGATLNDLVANFAKDNTLSLPAGSAVKLDETLVLDAPLTLTSNGDGPAAIVAKAGIVTSKNLTIKDLTVIATELESNLISLPSAV